MTPEAALATLIVKVIFIVLGYPVFVLSIRKALNCPRLNGEGLFFSFIAYIILVGVAV